VADRKVTQRFATSGGLGTEGQDLHAHGTVQARKVFLSSLTTVPDCYSVRH
jgi:hypothetical protein